MKGKSVIYETSGRAREFSELAMNLFAGCGHGCLYCYAPAVTHVAPDKFREEPTARLTPEEISAAARQWIHDHPDEKRRVLLCFTSDPYQPAETPTQLTGAAIAALHHVGLRVTILTKGGRRSMRDLDLLGPLDAYATTLTCAPGDERLRRYWEPGAAPTLERMAALWEAHAAGIETWVSLEPVVDSAAVPELIRMTKDFVGHYKLGKLNYHPWAKQVDWKKFGWETKALMDQLGVKYMIKKDLLIDMGTKDTGGSTGPANPSLVKMR